MLEEKRKEILERLKNLVEKHDGDHQRIHAEADEILLEWLEARGDKDIAEAYESVQQKVGFWYA